MNPVGVSPRVFFLLLLLFLLNTVSVSAQIVALCAKAFYARQCSLERGGAIIRRWV